MKVMHKALPALRSSISRYR